MGFLHKFLSPKGSAIRLIDTAIAFFWVFFRALQIARILHNEKCNSIVACTADLINLPAGYLASRLVGISFYPYIFDYYSYQWTDPFSRFFAGLFEPIVLRAASSVIVPNEYLGRELTQRYGVTCEVVHNPYDGPKAEGQLSWPLAEEEIAIVYTGAVYYVHYDAFRNLVAAIKSLDRKDLHLHIYTSDSHRLLQSKGIRGPVNYHDHLELSKSLMVQKQADILFLPLAFASDNPEIVKTSSPGKMGEYLASGRPILVHAPADSFVCGYFKQHGCGAVVDEENPRLLADALRCIIEQKELRNTMVERAHKCAELDFSLQSIQKKFQAILGLDGAEKPLFEISKPKWNR
jgi:glycosyltransferase involved in cell wall biosynthesis